MAGEEVHAAGSWSEIRESGGGWAGETLVDGSPSSSSSVSLSSTGGGGGRGGERMRGGRHHFLGSAGATAWGRGTGGGQGGGTGEGACDVFWCLGGGGVAC